MNCSHSCQAIQNIEKWVNRWISEISAKMSETKCEFVKIIWILCKMEHDLSFFRGAIKIKDATKFISQISFSMKSFLRKEWSSSCVFGWVWLLRNVSLPSSHFINQVSIAFCRIWKRTLNTVNCIRGFFRVHLYNLAFFPFFPRTRKICISFDWD